ncbi:MAG: ATP-binding protein [Candidatus Omnitrophota bacterium]
MVAKDKLKEIILANRDFIAREINGLARRENINAPENTRKIVIFYGVRRSGKTFILFDLMKRYFPQALYIDFEDERLGDFTGKDLENLKDAFCELFPELLEKKKYFFLDEIQNVKGWEKFCRRAVERENISIFTADSSSKIHPLEIHTSLRGRQWSIEITPFSFREYLSANNIPHTNEYLFGPKKIIVKKHFSGYMKWGGFPEVVLSRNDFDKKKLLNEYMQAMFFRDLVERFGMNNTHLLDSLADKLFSSFACKFSINAFFKQYKNRFPFSKDSLYEYYKNFIKSMLIFEVKIFAESTYKRQRNPVKIYVADPGIARKITSQDRGRVLENIVFLELRKNSSDIFYFTGRGECDFVAKSEKGSFACQVCFELNEENKEREIQGLLECCGFLGEKRGVILTHDQEDKIKVNNIEVIILPAWKWLLAKNKING